MGAKYVFNPLTGNLDTTDVVAFNGEVNLGTAAAPSVFFTGDTNTGIYSPGADQVALSTNGTGRLFVDASGRVGIGTSAQQYFVHAESANPRIVAVGTSSTSYSANESRNDIAASLTVLMRGSAATGTTFGQSNANGAQLYSVSADYLSVGTFQSDPLILGTNNAERLRITSAGLVGIGTSAVDEKLHIQGAGTQALKLVNTSPGSYASPQLSQIKFQGYGGSEKARLETADFSSNSSGGELRIYTRNTSDVLTQALVVDQSQRVGIGTTSPGGLLHLKQNNSNDGRLIIENDDGQFTINANDNTVKYQSSEHIFLSASGATEKARLDSSGRLLVGTTATGGMNGGTIVAGDADASNGSVALAVKYTSTDVINTFGSAYSSGNTVIGYGVRSDTTTFNKFLSTASNANWKRGVLQVGGELIYSNAAAQATAVGSEVTLTDRFTITNSGRVGIGTTSPATALDVNGAAKANYAIASGPLAAYASSSGGLYSYFASTAGTINAVTDNSGTAGTLVFATGTERARIDSSGRLLVGTSSAGSSRNIFGGFEFEVSQTGNNAWGHFTQYGNSYTNRGARLYLNFTSGTSAGSATAVTTEDELGAIHFRGANGTTFQSAAEIRGETDTGTISGTSMPGRLVFSVTADGASSTTERMRINSKGYIYVFGPDSAQEGAVQLTAPGLKILSSVDTANVQAEAFTGSVATRYAWAFTNPNGVVGSISTNGSATAYNTSSDYRLKENVTAVTDGITRLQQLKPSRFNFIADPDKTVDGFLAHEVQTVVPEAITGEKDAVDDEGNPQYQGIDQSKLVPLLTAALQEAIVKIETLEAKVAALENN